MAEALTTDEIADASGCFSCFADRFQVLLYLLDQIRLGGGGDAMTTEEIAEGAKCYCFADREAAALYLLNQILTNGASSSGQMSCGDGAPTLPPGDPNECAIYYDNAAGGVAYFWNVGTQLWQ